MIEDQRCCFMYFLILESCQNMFKRVKFTHNHTSYPFEWDFFVSCQYNIDRKVVSCSLLPKVTKEGRAYCRNFKGT